MGVHTSKNLFSYTFHDIKEVLSKTDDFPARRRYWNPYGRPYWNGKGILALVDVCRRSSTFPLRGGRVFDF